MDDLNEVKTHPLVNFVKDRWVLCTQTAYLVFHCNARLVLTPFHVKHKSNQQYHSLSHTRPGIRIARQFPQIAVSTCYLQIPSYCCQLRSSQVVDSLGYGTPRFWHDSHKGRSWLLRAHSNPYGDIVQKLGQCPWSSRRVVGVGGYRECAINFSMHR